MDEVGLHRSAGRIRRILWSRSTLGTHRSSRRHIHDCLLLSLHGATGLLVFVAILYTFTMESVHTIRLREPWEQRLTPEGCIHRRNFHAPTGVTPENTLWVVIHSQEVPVRLSCNGTDLGEVHREASFEITTLIGDINHLEMLFSAGDPRPQRGAVCLEIRSTQH